MKIRNIKNRNKLRIEHSFRANLWASIWINKTTTFDRVVKLRKLYGILIKKVPKVKQRRLKEVRWLIDY